ncbi:hypothetical protein C8J56DRAFT_889653 [Mycena floridula]|nr:hypothetical protein C8J56DRAFT_889653 [Mycena floridula]
MLILNMVEAAVAHLPKYHEPGYVRRGIGGNVETTETWYEVKNTICDDILPGYRIRYLDRQHEMRRILMKKSISELQKGVPGDVKRKEDIIEYLTRPSVTFYAWFSQTWGYPPVSFETLPVVCGSTYGRGIYSSPDPHFALMYSGTQSLATTPNGIPGLKFIVCATIMGRTMEVSRDDNWRNQNSAVLLHLDWEEFNDVETFVMEQILARMDVPRKKKPALKNEVLSPGDMQRQKQERLAQAQKYFGYGFGPVSGRKIVIQEIGEIEDDEEEYGQYQANRVDEVKTVDIWSDRYREDYGEYQVIGESSKTIVDPRKAQLAGETFLDEYGEYRKAKPKAMTRAKQCG